MSALITTRSPTSYQLRSAAVNCRKYPSPSVFLRMHVHKLEHQVRCFSGSIDNANVHKRRRSSGFAVNGFSGWSGDDNGTEDLKESPPEKGWSGGIVGAAVAGIVLVGGLTFAALSISRRASGSKKNMDTLTEHQEESLTSVDQIDNVEDEGTETKNDSYFSNENENENDNYISNEKENDSYISKEIENESATDNELGLSTNIEGRDVLKQDVQEELPELHKSDVDDEMVDASVIENLDDNLVAENFESSNNNLEDDSTDVKVIDSLVTDENTINPETGSDIVINGSDQSNSSPSTQNEVILEPLGSKFETPVLSDEVLPYIFESERSDIKETVFDLRKISSSASIPAPSVLSPALQTLPGKVLVPAVVDQVQGQALAALQVLKVIEGDVLPGDLCTRREYARWLVSASSALSRNTLSKVYPAMYIENVTDLAFDDITPEDPDFSSIQGLAEAGLIASKLSQRDMNISNLDENPLYFFPESPLSRQDLVSWKMSLEKRLLPEADRMILQQVSGFIDIDKINPDAWPALIADLSAGENGIVSLAFGYTRLFQPDKPVTKAQAAIALATGEEASDIVSEELARIEAESMAEKAVAAHSALVDQVQKDINMYYENDLLLERKKITALEKLAEETRQELDRLKAEQEEQNIKLMKERAAVDSQMEVLSKLRREAEEELQEIMSNKVEISYEKERINKLRTDAEIENQEIIRLQYELEVERKALAMARSWAEDEAKRAREQAKVVEDARNKWESQGIKVIVDKDLRDDESVTWVNAQKKLSVEETKTRAERLVDQLKSMAASVEGKSKQIINTVIEKVLFYISQLKELGSKTVNRVSGVKDGVILKVNGSMQDLQQSSVGLSSAVKDGVKRVVGDCREGVEKLSQKFKT
ncbi:hypothetical protein E3N88_43165 [Mikania micrantha]|uniref:SLH domain-containing protein n=1 Tax=Mikania micrantha TaxID=192012 RepID=A0A5N6LGI5_9ASTR|nr:hypothetical protein E3N88_43165 [Mikania micrantha]